MDHTCKICAGKVKARHTIGQITYYFCPVCQFLQNFYWEEHPGDSQTSINDEARADRWPAGARDYMHTVGWEQLQLTYWPARWHARRLHTILQKIPGYTTMVQSYIKKTAGRVLDFGCGHGTALLELRRRDHFDIIGLDPYSPTNNPSIIRTPLAAAKLAANSFDAIMAIETLEHITNPVSIFAQLHRILKPGGRLLVQTRRLEDGDYQQRGEQWFYLKDPKTHVSIYSEPALRRLAAITGWRHVQFKGTKFARLIK